MVLFGSCKLAHPVLPIQGQKKVVVKIITMNDSKTRQKAMEAVADVFGVSSIEANLKEQKLTVVGEMDAVEIAKRLKKLSKVDLISVGPAQPEKKDNQNKASDDQKKQQENK